MQCAGYANFRHSCQAYLQVTVGWTVTMTQHSSRAHWAVSCCTVSTMAVVAAASTFGAWLPFETWIPKLRSSPSLHEAAHYQGLTLVPLSPPVEEHASPVLIFRGFLCLCPRATLLRLIISLRLIEIMPRVRAVPEKGEAYRSMI